MSAKSAAKRAGQALVTTALSLFAASLIVVLVWVVYNLVSGSY